MSRFECPECGGGFPELPPEKECPWCGHPCNGETDDPVLKPQGTGVDLDKITKDVTDARPFKEQVHTVPDNRTERKDGQ